MQGWYSKYLTTGMVYALTRERGLVVLVCVCVCVEYQRYPDLCMGNWNSQWKNCYRDFLIVSFHHTAFKMIYGTPWSLQSPLLWSHLHLPCSRPLFWSSDLLSHSSLRTAFLLAHMASVGPRGWLPLIGQLPAQTCLWEAPLAIPLKSLLIPLYPVSHASLIDFQSNSCNILFTYWFTKECFIPYQNVCSLPIWFFAVFLTAVPPDSTH